MKEIVETGKILEIRSGSHLYGTNTIHSDEDFVGIFIAPKQYYLGFDVVNEVDLSKTSKLPNGKNAPDAIDRKFYEIKKFFKLAMDNNPNIIEILFANKENTIYKNEVWDYIQQHRSLFPWKGLKEKFIGYAISQKKKISIKKNNYEDLEVAYKLIGDTIPLKTYLAEHTKTLSENGFKVHPQFVSIGDLHIQLNIMVDRVLEQLKQRIDKFGNRKELVDDYGFDTKFASHCVRLLYEGKELLETGEIQFPLQQRQLLLAIRAGSYSLDEVLSMTEDIEDEIRLCHENTFLPKSPNYKQINDLLMEITETYLFRS